tara:strand:+ start:5983 stop:6672 length:690 start_codon:yes stop_codon:yes gene_type:complete
MNFNNNNFNSRNYKKLLNFFIKRNYKFVNYKSFKLKKNILLRHDVDFDVDKALSIAKIDYSLKIRSHFFFLVDSPFYNLLEKKNIEALRKISKMKHFIGLHLNMSNKIQALSKDDLVFKFEYLKKLIPASKIFSIHKYGSEKKNIYLNSFLNFYRKNITKIYYSDSGGKFRFGLPTQDFRIINQKKSFQLNIHPIWWIGKEQRNQKISNLIRHKNLNLINEIQSYKLIN